MAHQPVRVAAHRPQVELTVKTRCKPLSGSPTTSTVTTTMKPGDVARSEANKAGNKASRTVKKGANKVNNEANKAGNKAKEGAEDAWDSVKEGAGKATGKVKEGAGKAKDAVVPTETVTHTVLPGK